MAAFFSEVLDKFLSPVFLEEVRKKFHYDETQVREFQAVAEEMLPLMREEAIWEKSVYSSENKHQGESCSVIYEQVVMSLGNGIDCLQERYSERKMLSHSYMIEVLAGELLLQGYAAYNCYIQENTDWHVAKYHFLGSEEGFPLVIHLFVCCRKRVLHLLQNLRRMIRSGVEAFALTVAILIVQAEWQKAVWHGNECQS